MTKPRLLKANEISVRIKQVMGWKDSNGITNVGVVLLLYKTARVDMEILDETYGAENWQNDYKVINNNLQCGIGVKCDGEWVWKWDCGVESNTEEEKGEASDAFKRAGFRWGIGRELYTAPKIFVDAEILGGANEKDGRFYLKKSNQLLYVSSIEYDENRNIKGLTICNKNGKVWSK